MNFEELKRKKWFVPVVVLLVCGAIGGIITLVDGDDTTTTPTTEAVAETTEAKETEEATEEAKDDKEDQKKAFEDSLDGTFIFDDSVRNDKTGNWRLARYADGSKPQEDIALDYYNAYFTDDSEIHALINFTTKTTAKIAIVGGKLDVTTYEYVDKEEHDANILFGGNLLSETMIDLKTGEKEKIQ